MSKKGSSMHGGMVGIVREDPKAIGKGGKASRKKEEFSNGLTPAQRKLPKPLQQAILKAKKKKSK